MALGRVVPRGTIARGAAGRSDTGQGEEKYGTLSARRMSPVAHEWGNIL